MKYSIIPEYKNLENALALTTEYGVNFEYDDFFNPDVYENEEETEHRIQTYINLDRDRTGDTMHGAFLGIDIAAADTVIRTRSREMVNHSLKIASRLGVKGVVFHTGLIGGLRLESYLNNWLEAAVDFYTEKCREYPELCIYMENSFEQEPDIFVKLMDEMKAVSNFKICFDYGHALLTETPIEAWVKQLAPFIAHMHINDNDLKDDLHMALGTGKIDFEQYSDLVQKYGIDTSVLIEVNGYDKAKTSLEYMRK